MKRYQRPDIHLSMAYSTDDLPTYIKVLLATSPPMEVHFHMHDGSVKRARVVAVDEETRVMSLEFIEEGTGDE